jgi:pectate lyase
MAVRIGYLALFLVLITLASPDSSPAQPPLEGFGASTPAGAGGTVVHVTNLNDAGPGSLREAVSVGNRTVVFDVAGAIPLAGPIYVTGAFITIDGLSAPAPGITLRNRGLFIHGTRGAHDVIVRGLRVRNATADAFQVKHGAYNVVIDHCSAQGSEDGNLDITESSHDVTVSWSIFAEPAGSQKNALFKFNPSRVTLHHNLFVGARKRNPLVQIDNLGTPATDTTLDMRNNLVWDWADPDPALINYGTMIGYGARANVVANYYAAPGASAADRARALTVCEGDCYAGDVARIEDRPPQPDPASAALAHVAANVSGDTPPVNLDAESNQAEPFPAPPIDTQEACVAAGLVLDEAGVRPLDAVDQGYLAAISLAGCLPGTADLVLASLAVPPSVGRGATVQVSDSVQNRGGQPAGAFVVTYSVSTDTSLDAADIVLGTRLVGGLGPNETSAAVTSVQLPASLPLGSYHIVASADREAAVPDPITVNNTRRAPITLMAVNLVAGTLTAPATAGPGTAIAVTDTVTNPGPASPTPTTVNFYLSTDAGLDASDLLLGSRAVPALGAGASSTVTTALTLPPLTTLGSYHLIARVDPTDLIGESSETDNVRTRPLSVAATADLTITSVKTPGTVAPGAVVTVSDAVKNVGTGPAPASTITYRLSPDQGYEDADIEVGSRAVPALAGKTSNNGQSQVTIPAGTPPGNYYLVARITTTNGAPEVSTANNTRASSRFRVR